MFKRPILWGDFTNKHVNRLSSIGSFVWYILNNLKYVFFLHKHEIDLGLFHLKGYRRGGRLFFQTLPPSFYIFRLDPPSLILYFSVGPPSLRIFYGFRLYF